MHARIGGLLSVLLCALALSDGSARAEPGGPNANTVIGANPLLADGAQALMSGNWERGVQLTQLGLNGALSNADRAAAYSNLCAGYTALKQYETALRHCDQSMAILADNWRTWQNRAACLLGLGRIEEAMRDIERGLQLNPDSDALQKTLAIARDYERQHRERLQHLLES